MENIFIPKLVRVGFQNRSDTYTKKLAYVIYVDHKGVVRKERSWESWRNKDIEPVDYDNVATEGFVLNKEVGGYKSGWDFRQAYVRVYDPRGFEFEISVPNLIFILENTSSIKGKGLEGEFIYGWQGTELLLIPTGAPDYDKFANDSNRLYNKEYLKVKDLIVGATYRLKNVNNPSVYMGYFPTFKGRFYYNSPGGKKHVFVSDSERSYYKIATNALQSLGERVVECIDEGMSDNYSSYYEEMMKLEEFVPYDPSKDEFVAHTFDEFVKGLEDRRGYFTSRNGTTYVVWEAAERSSHYGSRDYANPNKKKYAVSSRSPYHGVSAYYDTHEEIYKNYIPGHINEYNVNGVLTGGRTVNGY